MTILDIPCLSYPCFEYGTYEIANLHEWNSTPPVRLTAYIVQGLQ